MPTYSMTRRSQQIRSQSFSTSSNVSGRKRIPVVEQAPPAPVQEDALLLDGDTGYLLQETNNKLLLDK